MKKFSLLFILTILLVTCSVPCYSIENSKHTKITKNNTTVKPTKNKYEYINLDWWKKFNDPILDDYITKAIEHNKDLNMATIAVNEYYQSVVAQRANEMPVISAAFSPAYTNAITQKSHGVFALPILASYELDIFGKNHNKTTSVRKLWEASILDERAAYISVASAVGSAYINIVRLDALIDLQEEIVDLRKDIFEIMDVSNKEGIISTSDLVKANKAYIASVTDLTELKKSRTKLLHALAVLIGDSPNNIEEYKRISYQKLAYTGNIPKTVPADVIVKRPDYLKAEKMIEKAGIDVRVARKEMIPSITLGGGVIFNNQNFGSLFNTSDMIWAFGGQIMQPIFMGGRLRANLKAKKLAYERSLKNYEKVNLTSMQEVNDSLVSINMDIEKLQKQKEIQRLEKQDFSLSQKKFDEGVIARLDLNQMKENLLIINKLVYASEFDCMIDYISYYKAVGANS